MRETSFIQQNEEKWREFEQVLEGTRHDPDKLNDLFIQVTDDLSHARTFYPNRSVRVYLNGLAQKIFFNIYKNKTSRRNRFISFWTNDLPELLYDARRELLLSFLVFVLAVSIGTLSCAADPEFLQVILGADYVEMTKENIKSGDPMAVYKERGEFNMFLGITLHNLMVAFQTFMTGIFYAIGTLGSLLYNGIMLGAFQYFFVAEGLFWESFLTVWMHGAFELSSIVLAGAAGLTMGRGLVFPGTLSRLRSFQLAARRGMSIMAGTVPLFILAGFTESYITRHTEWPDMLRGMYILLCLFFVVYYFVILPAKKARKGFARHDESRLTPEAERTIDFSAVKKTGDLFTDAFLFYRKKFKPIAWAAAAGAAIYCAGAFWTSNVPASQLFYFPGGLFGTFGVLPDFFINEHHPWLFPLATLALSIVVYVVQTLLVKEDSELPSPGFLQSTRFQMAVGFLKILAGAAIVNLVILTMNWYTVLLMLLSFPFLFLWMQTMLAERTGFIHGLGRAMQLTGGVFTQMTGLCFTLMLTGVLFFLVLDTGIFYFLLDFFTMNFFLSVENSQIFTTVLITFITMFVLLLIFGLWAAGGGLQYFSNLEIQEARFLKERIHLISMQKRIRGLERE